MEVLYREFKRRGESTDDKERNWNLDHIVDPDFSKGIIRHQAKWRRMVGRVRGA